MRRRERNVCTIHPGAPFLPTFARALMDGRILEGFPARHDPAALADATIYVPTRRAARALAVELARAAGGQALVLPRIVPLGVMEGVENDLIFGADSPADAWLDDVPDAVAPLERRLVLTDLILGWGKALRHAIRSVDRDGHVNVHDDEPMLVTTAPAQAFHLAADLAALIDEMIVEDIDWRRLEKLAPDDLDQYWRITLNFLNIAVKAWPAHLAEAGLLDRARRQAILVERRIAQMQAGADRVEIVAGSTGTNAATAKLIGAIAASPRGAVVLPGLDTELDEAAWRAIGGDERGQDPAASHAQAALRRLLPLIGVAREDVRELGDVELQMAARLRFVAQALRPAETTQTWRSFRESQSPAQLASALQGLAVLEAADEREEALAIAIALRETLETPGATAALITPDRNLARRVRAELARWNIEIDDSGGEPLANSPHGVLARLTLACIEPSCAAAPLLALLRHPLTQLGYEAQEMSRRVDLAEIGLLRGLRPDLSDIGAAVEMARVRRDDPHAHRTLKTFRAADFDAMQELLQRLSHALAPLRAMPARASVRQWAGAHARAVAALAQAPEGSREHGGPDAGAFALLMNDFAHAHDMKFDFAAADYEVFFDACAREAVVRAARANHPRIKSLGLLEARLIDVDVALLGGLDEASWPPAARTDAFLSRPMRAELGLSTPERRIGQTAHDFVQALGAKHVVISRALKRGGSPTTPSRFLQRLETLAGEAWNDCRQRGSRYLTLARRLDAPRPGVGPIKRPAPTPPLELRPVSLSVTRIETLRRDPYAIYAERILKLAPLDGVDLEEGAREAGTRMHGVLAKFQKAHPVGPSRPDAAAELEAIARQEFASDLRDAEFCAFHWPRVLANCAAFLAWDGERREDIAETLSEVQGELTICLRDGAPFKLTGTADRIERWRDGTYAVVDFKTGTVPSASMVNCGLSPQLTLEAHMIASGAFAGIPAGAQVESALYVKLGGKDGVDAREATKGGDPIGVAALAAYGGLAELLEQFHDETTPYLPRPYPQFVSVWGSYDHLSRFREWSAGGGGSGGDGQ